MTIIHIVLFRLKETTNAEKFCNDMVGLKDKCVTQETQKPYIVNSSGGEDNSPENAQRGFSHGFVVEFATKFDRDYYVFADPAHQAFKDSIVDKIDNVCVVDYQVGADV